MMDWFCGAMGLTEQPHRALDASIPIILFLGNFMIYTACHEQAPDPNSTSDQHARQRDHASFGRMGAATHSGSSLDRPYDSRRYVRVESRGIRLQEALRREAVSWTDRTQTGL